MAHGRLSGKKVLLFGQNKCGYSQDALRCLIELGCEVTTAFGNFRGEPFDEKFNDWHGDFIFSYKCYWRIPSILLNKATLLAINFHPATPEYPGSGSYSRALYDQRNHFGITVHKMNSKIDNGQILQVSKFLIDNSYSLQQLIDETNEFSIKVFIDFVQALDNKTVEELKDFDSETKISWTGSTKKISDLNKMSELTIGMSKEEVDLRIRAFHIQKFPLTLNIWGYKFKLV
jgi:methionyl-tRNA formyltransferase